MLNKENIIAKIQESTGLNKTQSTKALNALLDTIKSYMLEWVKSGDMTRRITFNGFGTFYVYERKQTTGVNPKTLQKILIPAKKVIKFKPSRVIYK